jgi:hypothetical protein
MASYNYTTPQEIFIGKVYWQGLKGEQILFYK